MLKLEKGVKKDVKVEDYLTIEIIDKKTGKVISKETTKRSLGSPGAYILICFIAGKYADANTVKDWKYVYLFNASKAIIKYLTGTWGSPSYGANYIYCVLTATDDSSDAYTTAYQGLSHRTTADNLNDMNIWQQQTKSKTSEQTLRITWEVRAPYVSPP